MLERLEIQHKKTMAKFTTRVELHNANYENYETLHSAMESEGFTRQISDGKKTYRLPTAEYNRETSLKRSAVLASAETAANTTGRRYSILVTESNGRKWTGLEEI